MTVAAGDRESLIIRAVVELADTLVDDYDVIDLLDRLASHSVELLAAGSAGILLGDAESTLRVVATTDERTEWMELLQLQAEEGPCLDCYRSGTPVSVIDLADAAVRWPRFIAALAERGAFGSVHALPLRLRGERHRHAQPVSPRTRSATGGRPCPRPGAGRCGHYRNPVRSAPSAAVRPSTNSYRPR